MKHYRQTIRESVETLLSSMSATIYRTRVYPMTSLPAISVQINNELVIHENSGPLNAAPRYTREADLTIEVAHESESNVDDAVDDLVAQVEALIGADVTLGGAVEESILTRCNFTTNGSGDVPYMIATLTYRVWYRTTASDPQTAI